VSRDRRGTRGLDLDRFLGLPASASLADREHWERISRKLASGEMPPKGVARPPAEGVAALRAWIEGEYARSDRAAKLNPVRVTARLLSLKNEVEGPFW
jgi:hypothetical protein